MKPGSADAAYGRGLALSALGYDDDAIGAYEKTLALDPSFTDAAYNKGLALFRTGRYKDAIKAFDYTLENVPVVCVRTLL